MSTYTAHQVCQFAASVKPGTALDQFTARWTALESRDAHTGHAKSALASAALRVLSADDLVTLFPKGFDAAEGTTTYVTANQVRNYAAQFRFWTATGFGSDSIGRAWTIVTSSRQWFPKWTTEAGKALAKSLADAADDDARWTILTGAVLPKSDAPAPKWADLVTLVQRAREMAEALAGDPSATEARDILSALDGIDAASGATTIVESAALALDASLSAAPVAAPVAA